MSAPAATVGAPPPPLEGSQLALGTLALSLATFMNVLDSSIANVSLPAIAGDLGVSPSQGTWVITSFGVANAISVPLTGWLTQRFGAVKLFTWSVLLFVLASWLCGFAPSLEALIVFRVMQGRHHLAPLPPPRDADPAVADRHRGAGAAGDLGGRAATDARQGA